LEDPPCGNRCKNAERYQRQKRSETFRNVQKRIAQRIDSLSREPEKQGKPLLGELKTFRSIRVAGQRYRIIYRVERESVSVLIVALGIRKEGSKRDVYELPKNLFGKD